MKNIILKIWNWVWNLRNRFSIYYLAFWCFVFNFPFLFICLFNHGSGCEAIILPTILYGPSIMGIFCLLLFTECIFKKLRFPDCKIFKVLHVFNIIHLGTTLGIFLFILCYSIIEEIYWIVKDNF